MLVLNVGNENDKTMVALCINLATDPLNTQHIIKKNRLQSLIIRAFTYQDAMLMKMIRNVSDNLASAPSFIVSYKYERLIRVVDISLFFYRNLLVILQRQWLNRKKMILLGNL